MKPPSPPAWTADPASYRAGAHADLRPVLFRVLVRKAVNRLKDQLRILTRRSWRVSMDYRIGKLNRFTTGWMAYFRLADPGRLFRDLDGWLRRRLRQVRWKEWKTTAAKQPGRWSSLSRCGVCLPDPCLRGAGHMMPAQRSAGSGGLAGAGNQFRMPGA